MTLSMLAYGMVLAVLLAAAAHYLDGALRALGRPTRWIWMTAMVGALAGPAIPPLLPFTAPDAPEMVPGLPLQYLYSLARGPVADPASGWAPALRMVESGLPPFWMATTLLLALLFMTSGLRLWKAGRSWPRRTVQGEDVLLSGGLGPAVLGLVRPKIVLPPWALSLESEELEMVLLHEREHRQARDPALLAAGILAVLASPLNPGLWWMLHRLRLAVEGDCDGRVLARGTPRKRYASLLVDVASRGRETLLIAPALTEGGTSFLERRLGMMQRSMRKDRVRQATGALVVAGLFLALACETPTPPVVSEADGPTPTVTLRGDPGQATPPTQAPDGLLVVERVPGSDGAAESSPLVIMDGVDVSDPDLLRALVGREVGSVQVFRGAEAVRRYGERGANGVIRITTEGG